MDKKSLPVAHLAGRDDGEAGPLERDTCERIASGETWIQEHDQVMTWAQASSADAAMRNARATFRETWLSHLATVTCRLGSEGQHVELDPQIGGVQGEDEHCQRLFGRTLSFRLRLARANLCAFVVG